MKLPNCFLMLRLEVSICMSEKAGKLTVSSEELYFVKRNAELIMQLASSILPAHLAQSNQDEARDHSERKDTEHEQRASP